MYVHPRSDWTDRAPKDITPMPARPLGVVVHYPGMGAPRPVEAVPELLREWQRMHMDDKGWDDIAYQVAVDQRGERWELRTFAHQSAANGSAPLNRLYLAVLAVLGDDEAPTEAMLAGLRMAVRDGRAAGAGTLIYPHSFVRPSGTRCPGPVLRARLAELDPAAFPAIPPTPPPPTPAPAPAPAAPAGPAFPLPPGWYFGPYTGPRESVSGYQTDRRGRRTPLPRSHRNRDGLATWQGRMAERGWSITVDGLWGDQTEGVARAFQTEKRLDVDGLVGPQTWRAAWSAPVT